MTKLKDNQMTFRLNDSEADALAQLVDHYSVGELKRVKPSEVLRKLIVKAAGEIQ